MRRRRQFMAAGLLLVAAFMAAPIRVAPAAPPALPAVSSAQRLLAVPGSLIPAAYLPLVANPANRDLAISRVEVIQGITLGDSYTTHIAGRPALLRVFVSLEGSDNLAGVSARVQRFAGGLPQTTLTAGPLTVSTVTHEGNPTQTFNFELPADWLNTGSAYVVQLDPDNGIAESNEINNRYPAAGEQPFTFVNMAPLNVVIVPVRYKGIDPPLGDLSYLTWMPSKVLPVSHINYTMRPVVHPFNGDLTTGNGWSSLLQQIHSIHISENPAGDKLYFGLVDSVAADGCSNGCIAGIGYISHQYSVAKTSAGFAGWPQNRNSASTTFTHEMGHNFGRRHAPCGNPGGPDLNYPYANAIIGQWGYDNATGQFKNPTTHYDYMSYCGSNSTTWTSDYTYHGIAQAWGWLNGAAAAAASADTALVVSGYIAPDGSVQVDPVFQTVAATQSPPALPTHRLELLDSDGAVLASLPFAPTEIIIDTPAGEAHAAGFHVLAAPLPGLAGLRLYHGSELLYERFVSGAAPLLSAAATTTVSAFDSGQRVSWQLTAGPVGTRYRVRFSPDGGTTWHVLALSSESAQVEVPASLVAGAKAPVLEVQASDGVRSDLMTFPLPAP